MFCPKCGSSQTEELKFCKGCGANLFAVRQVVNSRETSQKFDWSKTGVADTFLSEEERKRRESQLDLQQGVNSEVKRVKEIKDGVISTSVGIAVTIFLFVLMQGIIRSGDVKPGDVEILSRVWVAGLIPFMVGLGLIVNGVFVSKHFGKNMKDTSPLGHQTIDQGPDPRRLRPAETTEFLSPPFGITEGTTKHLSVSGQKKSDEF
jgi:hypothetical protein